MNSRKILALIVAIAALIATGDSEFKDHRIVECDHTCGNAITDLNPCCVGFPHCKRGSWCRYIPGRKDEENKKDWGAYCTCEEPKVDRTPSCDGNCTKIKRMVRDEHVNTMKECCKSANCKDQNGCYFDRRDKVYRAYCKC